MKNIFAPALIVVIIFSFFGCSENPEDKKKREMDIEYLRIIGRAYLEEDRLDEAKETFNSLIEAAPDDASGYANLGLVFLKQNKYDEAKTKIEKALKKAPGNPDILMISAQYFVLTNNTDKAISELQKIIKADPDYAKAYYSLAGLYELSGAKDALAQREKYLRLAMEKAPGNIVPRLDLTGLLMKKGDPSGATQQLEELPKLFPDFPKEAASFYEKAMAALHAGDNATATNYVAMFQNFLKVTSQYQSDLRDLEGPNGSLAGLSVVSISDFNMMHAQADESILDRIRFLDITSNMGLNPATENGGSGGQSNDAISHLTLGDYDGDGYVDVYFGSFSPKSNHAVNRLLRNHRGVWFEEQTKEAGLDHDGPEDAALFGDFDNDGYFDLYVVKDGPNMLYKNDGKGVFTDVAADAKVADPEPGRNPLFLDADHDGDLDLLVVRSASNLLYRNNSDGTFTEMADAMGLGLPVTRCSDAAFADFDEDGDLDLVFSNDGAAGYLLTNQRHGRFADISAGSGLEATKAAVAVVVADYNNDGFNDLLLLSKNRGRAELLPNNGDGTFAPAKTAWMKSIRQLNAKDAAFFDFDNDGFLDLLLAGVPASKGTKGVFLFHNDGNGSFDDVSNLLPSGLAGGQQIETADFDKDGDLDVFIAGLDGRLHLLQNEGGNINHYLKLQLVGLRNGNNKNNHFGIGAKVEVRAGDLYQMKVVTEPSIHFGLGSHLKANVVRILWTNGTPQNLFFPGSDQDLIESQVLKGSCAFLYTWDGEKYVFSKDMMWRSALGMPLGIMGANTAYAPADPSQEYLKIPGEKMKLQGDKYTIQVTEELWETAYFDKLELVAIDHPETEQIFVDERFTLPPYTDEYQLYAVQKKWHPVSAVDAAGTNLLPQILLKDNHYISNFQLADYQGITEMRDLVLDPGKDLPPSDLLLYLNGWIFPSDASINVALAQGGNMAVTPPQLQVLDNNGLWKTVIPNIGFPMGKDKTMVVDLSGKFLSEDRRIRIRTNMEIYWDEIFFAPKAQPEAVVATRMKPAAADLHYRGFSALYRKGGRYGPHWFDYGQVTTSQKWRDLIGNYTRFGEVAPLLATADDKLVIMNSGDEMTVSFDATQLPPLKAGWERDFLIYSEGWIKDGDLNTAHSKTVEPLPFHGMTRYPYGGDEAYPSDAEHLEYLKEYNTRTVDTKEFRRAVMDFQ